MPLAVPSLQDALIQLTGDEVPADALVLEYSTHENLSAPYSLVVEFSTKEQFFARESRRDAVHAHGSGAEWLPALPGRPVEGALVRNVGDKLHFSLTLKPKLAWLSAREKHADLPSTTIPKILEAILEEAGLTDSTKLSLSEPMRTASTSCSIASRR